MPPPIDLDEPWKFYAFEVDSGLEADKLKERLEAVYGRDLKAGPVMLVEPGRISAGFLVKIRAVE